MDVTGGMMDEIKELKRFLVEAYIPLRALELAVKWEVIPEIMELIKAANRNIEGVIDEHYVDHLVKMEVFGRERGGMESDEHGTDQPEQPDQPQGGGETS